MHPTSPDPTAPRRAAEPTGYPLPQAVLWDMDGTLVDTEPYWIAAEHELVEAHGGTWSHEQGLQMVGNPWRSRQKFSGRRGGPAGRADHRLPHLARDRAGQGRDPLAARSP
ncbi:HAD hydrolase-like protein [Oerskovia sp. M15]